jgi:uncharacterized protein YukE
MSIPIHGSAAQLRSQLDHQWQVVSRTLHAVSASAGHIPTSNEAGWHGPASFGYQLGLEILRRELERAVDLLRAAERSTAEALVEAEHRG